MQIKDCSLALDCGIAREDGGDMSFVRRLIRGEARVTIDAVYSLCRRRDVSQRKAGYLFIQAPDKFQHGVLDQGFILFFARLEPFAAIVALERTEK